MGRFSTGLCSVSFRENSPEEIIRAAGAAGLDFIEWGSDVHAPYTDTEKLQNIAKLQREYGISTSSYGTYFRIGQTDISELCGYIRAAKLLGTDMLRLWCGVKGSADTDAHEKKSLFDSCREAASIAESEGVVLAMECHMGTYTDTAETIVQLMNEVNSGSFRIYWQPNQYRTREENIRHINMTRDFVTVIHAFNWERDKRYPLADATDIWCEYLSYIKGEHTVLLEFMPHDDICELETEAAALRSITENVKEIKA